MNTGGYYTLGRSGLRVSRLALGAMTFGTESGWGVDEGTARGLFDAYVDAGGNFIDTADMYTNGTSETFVGKFVADRHIRDRVVLATKYTYSSDLRNPNAGGNHRKNLVRALDGSLRRLQTDYVDLYLLHTWDRLTPAEEVMRALDDQVRAGKIRYVGLSDVPAWYAARAQTLAEWRGFEAICALQMEYSLVERNIEREHVPLALALGMGIVAWSPLASGLLSGKYSRTTGRGPVDSRLYKERDSANPGFQKFGDRNWTIVDALESVANELGQPMAAVAVNWIVNRAGVASVIVGASKRSQLMTNLQALTFSIPPECSAHLEQAGRPQPQFPYTFFDSVIQTMIHGSAPVGDKPPGYCDPSVAGGGHHEQRASNPGTTTGSNVG